MKSTINLTPNIHTCARCHVASDWRRSTSRFLKMTYCNSLCEAADLGFTIEGFLECGHPPPVATAVHEPVRRLAAATSSAASAPIAD